MYTLQKIYDPQILDNKLQNSMHATFTAVSKGIFICKSKSFMNSCIAQPFWFNNFNSTLTSCNKNSDDSYIVMGTYQIYTWKVSYDHVLLHPSTRAVDAVIIPASGLLRSMAAPLSR